MHKASWKTADSSAMDVDAVWHQGGKAKGKDKGKAKGIPKGKGKAKGFDKGKAKDRRFAQGPRFQGR